MANLRSITHGGIARTERYERRLRNNVGDAVDIVLGLVKVDHARPATGLLRRFAPQMIVFSFLHLKHYVGLPAQHH